LISAPLKQGFAVQKSDLQPAGVPGRLLVRVCVFFAGEGLPAATRKNF